MNDNHNNFKFAMRTLISPCLRFPFSCRAIPVVNLAPYVKGTGNWRETASLVRQACKDTGFFCISNHGVSRDLQRSIVANMKRFFDLPLYQKKTIDINKSGVLWKGYFEFAQEHTGSKPDLIEGILYRRELDENHPNVRRGLPFHGANPFLSSMPDLKRDVLLWLNEMDKLGAIVSMLIADSLGLQRHFFGEGICNDHLGTLGLFHYPPIKYREEDWGVGEHTDYGFLTLLMFDQPRLEVQTIDGKWIEVDPIPDTFVVNIGDVLEVLTKGLYKSTLHRARNYSKVSRFALPYFYDVNWYAELKALDIKISPEEQRIIDRVRAIERWDRAQLHQVKGIFGHYYCKKIMAEFPYTLRKKVEQLII